MASRISTCSPKSPQYLTNGCISHSSNAPTPSSTQALVLTPGAQVPYTSVWKQISEYVHHQTACEAVEKSKGDIELESAIAAELSAKFERVCDASFVTLQLQPFYELMNDDLKMAFYEVYVWDNMCTEAEFPGDASALEEFKKWYFDTQDAALKEEQYEYDADSGSDGGVAVRSRAGSRVGDGETVDRYADGETESTDGGAKLRWY